jgi:hypothetical protein
MRTRPTTLTAYRWELRKLASQKRTYIGIALPLAASFVISYAATSPASSGSSRPPS